MDDETYPAVQALADATANLSDASKRLMPRGHGPAAQWPAHAREALARSQEMTFVAVTIDAVMPRPIAEYQLGAAMERLHDALRRQRCSDVVRDALAAAEAQYTSGALTYPAYARALSDMCYKLAPKAATPRKGTPLMRAYRGALHDARETYYWARRMRQFPRAPCDPEPAAAAEGHVIYQAFAAILHDTGTDALRERGAVLRAVRDLAGVPCMAARAVTLAALLDACRDYDACGYDDPCSDTRPDGDDPYDVLAATLVAWGRAAYTAATAATPQPGV